jgi:hypothetical protein
MGLRRLRMIGIPKGRDIIQEVVKVKVRELKEG